MTANIVKNIHNSINSIPKVSVNGIDPKDIDISTRSGYLARHAIYFDIYKTTMNTFTFLRELIKDGSFENSNLDTINSIKDDYNVIKNKFDFYFNKRIACSFSDEDFKAYYSDYQSYIRKLTTFVDSLTESETNV
jgi:hypothetical protein